MDDPKFFLPSRGYDLIWKEWLATLPDHVPWWKRVFFFFRRRF